MQSFYFFADPLRFCILHVCKVADHRPAIGQHRKQFLWNTFCVFCNKGISCRQNLRSRPVIFHHHNGLCSRELFIKIQKITPVGTPPCINGLVRVSYHKQVLMPGAENFHQFILQIIDILEFINHNVFQPLLPFQPYLFPLLKDVQRKFDQIVIVQPETFLFLIQVSVKDDIFHRDSVIIFFLQRFQRQGNHIPVIFRPLEQFKNFNPVPGHGKGHVPQGQAPLLVDNLQHSIHISIIQHQETFWILDRKTVLLEYGNTKAVERINIPGIVVPRQVVNTLAHLVGRFIGKGYTQNIARQDAQLVYQKSKTAGQSPCFAGTGSGDDADKTFRGTHSFPLGRIQFLH